MNEDSATENDSGQVSKKKMSRRDFLKYGAGATAATIGAAALLDKIPLPRDQPKKITTTNDSSEPIVATVSGDQVTVMNGQVIVKTKDSGLAALIAEKVNSGD